MHQPVLLAGRYRLIEPIGAGGMSVVWRAHDEVLGRPVAVKVLAAPYAADQAFRERIRDEAKAVALLEHPHATRVYDYGESASREPFLVMELVDGVPLSDRLAAGPTPWRLAVELLAQAAAALSAAHARGLVHRDVTAANIMVTAAGAKVIDFGVAAVVGARGGGPLIGTPAYLAPERLTGDPGGPAADVYGLGVVLYEALTGRLPWPAAQRPAHAAAESLPPIPGLPGEVAALVDRSLAKDPADRPTSSAFARALAAAAGVRVALDGAVLDGAGLRAPATPARVRGGTRILLKPPMPEDQPEPPWTPPPRRVVPLTWAAAAAVLASLVVAGVVAFALGGDRPRRTEAAPQSSASAPATEASPTGPPRPGCAIRYVARERDNGATIDIAITNTGSTPINGWTLAFEVRGASRLSSSWNGRWSLDDGQITVRSVDQNAVLAPGESVLTRPGANLVSRGRRDRTPERFTLNGTVCAIEGVD